MAISYVPLEQETLRSITGKTEDTTISGTLFSSTSFLYTLFFVVIIVAASFRYAYAGILRMSASESGIKESKEEFKRVTYGLLGVLSLWLILATFNRDMLTGDVGLGGLRTSGYSGAGSHSPSIVSTQTGAGSVANSGSHTYAERVADHNRVVSRLAPSNIHTNHNDQPCTENQYNEAKPSCTSLAFLSEETIQKLININGSCHCTLVITGGTEPGHAENGSHGEGKRGVDLRIKGYPDVSDPLYVYITSISQKIDPTSACYTRFQWSTYKFCDEKPRSNSTWNPHFHVD